MGEFDTPRGYLYTRSMKTQKQAPDAQAAALRRRLHMVEGQIEGIVRMMDEERGCIDILTQFKAAQAGLDVLVVEASPTIGGMTATNPFEPEAPGYTINEASMQASLFRTTTIDKDLGLSKKFGLKQTVIDPAHVQMNYDGTSLAMWRDPRRTADELRYFSPADAEARLDAVALDAYLTRNLATLKGDEPAAGTRSTGGTDHGMTDDTVRAKHPDIAAEADARGMTPTAWFNILLKAGRKVGATA